MSAVSRRMQYEIGKENSVHLFLMTSSYGELILGMIWTVAWIMLIDVWPYLIIWFVVSTAFGMLAYIGWLYISQLIYGTVTTNAEIVEIVDRAKNKLKMKEYVEVWVKNSTKLICMAAKTPPYTAVLLSPIAVNDILNHPKDGEVVIAYKLSEIRESSPYRDIQMAVFQFWFGIFLGLVVSITIADLSGFAQESFMETVLMVMAFTMYSIVIGVLVLAMSCTTGKGYDSVEEIYRTSPYNALMRVFGRKTISEEM